MLQHGGFDISQSIAQLSDVRQPDQRLSQISTQTVQLVCNAQLEVLFVCRGCCGAFQAESHKVHNSLIFNPGVGWSKSKVSPGDNTLLIKDTKFPDLSNASDRIGYTSEHPGHESEKGEIWWTDVKWYPEICDSETERNDLWCNTLLSINSCTLGLLRQVQGSGLWARLASWSRSKGPIHPFRENSTGKIWKVKICENLLEISCNVLERVGIHFQPCLA